MKTTKYILIGGHAVSIYGFPRNTIDIDIVVPYDVKNTERLIRILSGLGYKNVTTKDGVLLSDIYALSPLELHRYGTVTMSGTTLWMVDVLFTHKFDVLYKASRIVHYERIPIRVVGLKDLIDMKTKAGRPQDIIDLQHLAPIK